MKKREPEVIRYHPYFETVLKDNLIFTRDRDIHVKAKDEIKKFEEKISYSEG